MEHAPSPDRYDRMRYRRCGASGLRLPAMSLAWILRRPETTSVIVGASRPEQLLASLAALDGPAFADDELARLDALLSAPDSPTP